MQLHLMSWKNCWKSQLSILNNETRAMIKFAWIKVFFTLLFSSRPLILTLGGAPK
jgi:hypothetical protein